jgi:GntR family transcriptional repressor for pyruvate dehydrogenase complex
VPEGSASLRIIDDTPNKARHRTVRVSELVARELVAQIVDDDLPSGTMLPSEQDMIEAFGVARATLRGGLRLLETRGVIELRSGPKGGRIVRRPKPADLAAAFTLILQFEGATIADVVEARFALEPTIVRLATEHITVEQLNTLEEITTRMREHLDDPDLFLKDDAQFWKVIAEATGNVVLWLFHECLNAILLNAALQPVAAPYPISRRKAVASGHLRVVKALRERNPLAAAQAMNAHTEQATRFWRHHYAPYMADDIVWTRQ